MYLFESPEERGTTEGKLILCSVRSRAVRPWLYCTYFVPPWTHLVKYINVLD